jgi:hypothetical protein
MQYWVGFYDDEGSTEGFPSIVKITGEPDYSFRTVSEHDTLAQAKEAVRAYGRDKIQDWRLRMRALGPLRAADVEDITYEAVDPDTGEITYSYT